jgi:hypothetical protein
MMRATSCCAARVMPNSCWKKAMISRYLPDPKGDMAAALRARIPTEYAIRIVPRWVRGHGLQQVTQA